MAAKKQKGTESGHRYPTRWKLARDRKKNETHILHLPREIIFNILCLFPADFLHDVVRNVCKHWNSVVSDLDFIRAHSQTSSDALIFQDNEDMQLARYIELDNGRLKVANVRIPFPARVMGSCNGLVLLHDLTNTEILHVMNLVTKVEVTLPPVVGDRRCRPSGDGGSWLGSSIGVESSSRYKVVQTSPIDGCEQVRVRIFTLGVDKAWRCIDLHGLPVIPAIGRRALLYRPLFIAGFFFWHNVYRDFAVFAMDVDMETINPLSGPTGINFHGGGFLNMGTTIGVYQCSGIHALDIRIWKLIDIRFGEWTELAGVNFPAMFDRAGKKLGDFPNYLHCVNLIDGMFWFYCHVGQDKRFAVGHNIANESFVYFPTKLSGGSNIFIPHMRTLVSPKNC